MSARRRNTRGFTLIELVIVVAIVGLVLTLAAGLINASRRKANVQTTVQDLSEAVLRARNLALLVGPRLFDPATNFTYTGCTAPAAGENPLQIVVNPDGTFEVPTRVTISGADVAVECETGNLLTKANGAGELVGIGAPLAFGFAPKGRVTGTLAPLVRMREVESQHVFGFRVLPSGLTCVATVDDPTNWCDTDS